MFALRQPETLSLKTVYCFLKEYPFVFSFNYFAFIVQAALLFWLKLFLFLALAADRGGAARGLKSSAGWFSRGCVCSVCRGHSGVAMFTFQQFPSVTEKAKLVHGRAPVPRCYVEHARRQQPKQESVYAGDPLMPSMNIG